MKKSILLLCIVCMGYVMNAAELKLQFFDKSWRPVLFVKCEVIHMVTGVTVRFFDLGGYNVTTISGLTEGQSYMVRYLQYGYADDWLESIIRISSPSTKVSLIFPTDGIIVTPNLLDTDCHQIRAADSTNDILVLIRDKIFTGILNEERFYSKIA